MRSEKQKLIYGWESTTLGDRIFFEYGKSPNKVRDKKGKYPLMGSSGIAGKANKYTTSSPAIILGRKGTIDKPIYSVTPCWAIDTTYFVDKFPKDESKYIFYLLNHQNLKSLNESTGVPSLSRENIHSLKVILPPLPEQKKITKILSGIDKGIEEVQLEIRKVEELKTAILTRFLNKEVNDKRIDKDFKINKSQKLRVTKFDDLISIISGKGFQAKDYTNVGVRLLRIDNVHWGRIKWDSMVFLPPDFIKKESKLVLKKGDILLALNRPLTQGKLKIARCSQADVPSILYQRVGKIYSKDESQITNSFIFYLMQHLLPEFIKNESVGSDQPFINLKTLRSLQLKIPEPREQIRIVNILESIDICVETKVAKLSKLKFLRNGISNDLLSGRKRVKI